MRRLRLLIFVMAILGGAASNAPGPVANADPPAPGDSCTVLHATTPDVNGRTLWCNATMTGNHSLVWQYGGPS
jgi:hypothetical protein